MSREPAKEVSPFDRHPKSTKHRRIEFKHLQNLQPAGAKSASLFLFFWDGGGTLGREHSNKPTNNEPVTMWTM